MLLLFIYFFFAVGISFICSVLEAVLLSVTPSYVTSLKSTNPAKAALLKKLKDKVDQPLAAILTLNTVAHTAGAAGVGAQSAVVFGSAYLGVTSAVLTLLILVLSEIIPKTLGATYWRSLAPYIATPLRLMITLLKPFIWMSDMITRVIGKSAHGGAYIRDEIAAMASMGGESGELGERESKIIQNLLKFRDTRLNNIMTPRTVVFSVNRNLTVAEYLKKHSDSPFSRILVYRKDRDDIVGYVHKTDIMLANNKKPERKIGAFVKPIYVVPETVNVTSLFQTLLEKRTHISLVVDEYGDMQGIVTMEDMVETLMGLEIVDEADKTVDMQQLAKQKWAERQTHEKLIQKPE